MSEDIVIRLRNWHTDHDSAFPRPIDLEAADEIEEYRLQFKRYFDMITELRLIIEDVIEDRDRWKRLFLEMYEKDGTTDEMMYTYRKEKW